jgi:hypothetical protein
LLEPLVIKEGEEIPDPLKWTKMKVEEIRDDSISRDGVRQCFVK